MSAKYLLDTNTVIFFFRGNQTVLQNWTSTVPSEVAIASITLFELFVGATTSSRPQERMRQLRVLLNTIDVIPFHRQEAERAAFIRGHLQQSGLLIGLLDTLIAGIAMAHGLMLVTNNISEFQRVPGLSLVDWSRP